MAALWASSVEDNSSMKDSSPCWPQDCQAGEILTFFEWGKQDANVYSSKESSQLCTLPLRLHRVLGDLPSRSHTSLQGSL